MKKATLLSLFTTACVPCPDGAVPLWSDSPCGEAPADTDGDIDEDGPSLIDDHPCNLISAYAGGYLVPLENNHPQRPWVGTQHATMEFQSGLIGFGWHWTSLPSLPDLHINGAPAVIEPVNLGDVNNELVLWDISDIGDYVWIQADSMPGPGWSVVAVLTNNPPLTLNFGAIPLEDGSALLWYRNEYNVDSIQHWYLDTGIRGWHQPADIYPGIGSELAGPGDTNMEATVNGGTIFRRVHGWCNYADGADGGTAD